MIFPTAIPTGAITQPSQPSKN